MWLERGTLLASRVKRRRQMDDGQHGRHENWLRSLRVGCSECCMVESDGQCINERLFGCWISRHRQQSSLNPRDIEGLCGRGLWCLVCAGILRHWHWATEWVLAVLRTRLGEEIEMMLQENQSRFSRSCDTLIVFIWCHLSCHSHLYAHICTYHNLS